MKKPTQAHQLAMRHFAMGYISALHDSNTAEGCDAWPDFDKYVLNIYDRAHGDEPANIRVDVYATRRKGDKIVDLVQDGALIENLLNA